MLLFEIIIILRNRNLRLANSTYFSNFDFYNIQDFWFKNESWFIYGSKDLINHCCFHKSFMIWSNLVLYNRLIILLDYVKSNKEFKINETEYYYAYISCCLDNRIFYACIIEVLALCHKVNLIWIIGLIST